MSTTSKQWDTTLDGYYLRRVFDDGTVDDHHSGPEYRQGQEVYCGWTRTSQVSKARRWVKSWAEYGLPDDCTIILMYRDEVVETLHNSRAKVAPEAAPESADTDLDSARVLKLLTVAAHPTTNEHEALTALTKARQHLAAANAVPADVFATPTASPSPKGSVSAEMSEFSERIRKVTEIIDEYQKRLAEQAAEIEALEAEKEALEAQLAAQATPTSGEAPTLAGLVAALQVLRKIDPEMRIKTALAYLHAAANGGVSVKETAEAVGGISEGSIRYAFKTLGSGKPGKPGYGLLHDIAAPTGNSRVHYATPKGRTTLNAMMRAMAHVCSGPELRLVA